MTPNTSVVLVEFRPSKKLWLPRDYPRRSHARATIPASTRFQKINCADWDLRLDNPWPNPREIACFSQGNLSNTALVTLDCAGPAWRRYTRTCHELLRRAALTTSTDRCPARKFDIAAASAET